MNYISVKHLKAVGACEDEVIKFKKVFGEFVSFGSLEEAKALAKKYAQDFDFGFIGEAVFGEAYLEAEAPLFSQIRVATYPLKAYKGAEAQLFAEMWWNKQ